jgi:hypothetical protein
MESSAKLTFKRYESKYLLSREKFAALWPELEPYLEPDDFFRSTVCSVYYDCEDFRLIRRSIEKPVYKEKLRVRSYNVPNPEDEVFVELKKKYRGVVYKRRISMPAAKAEQYLDRRLPAQPETQISREIDWFLKTNPVSPKVMIASDRRAYRAKENPELRVTFDSSIRWRETSLSLMDGDWGQELLENGQILMELKIPEAAPLWLAHLLSRLEIFPQSFSKYGRCYKTQLLEKYFGQEPSLV